jgi:hypothetical protein
MHLSFLLVALLTGSIAASLQDTPVSSVGVTSPPTPASTPASEASTADLPVSLDRIRDGLAVSAPLQESLLKRPTFKVEVEETHHLSEVLGTLDLKAGPAPPGGLYGYETQRVMLSSLNQPLLMQPYAAFSGGELLTLALEGLMTKYLGGRAMNAVTTADRSRAEAAARAEVAHAIADYCGTLPDAGVGVRLCTTPASP